MLTMCGWRILPASDASFWNCWRYTAPNSGSRNTSGSIVFSATWRPVNVSFARYTVPVAPLPRLVWISYLPTWRLSPVRLMSVRVAALESCIDVGGLHDRIELDRVAALLARAVARAFAAAEGNVVVHAGGRQVHHDHARGGIALEVLRVFERRGGDAGGESESGVVRHGERFVVVLDADHRGDRAEDFLAVDRHRLRRLREECGLEVEPLGCALQARAAGGELRAFLLAELDVLQVLVELRLVDDRADVRAFLHRIVDLQILHFRRQRGHELVVNSFSDDEPAGSRAALSGREERALQRHVHRDVEVRVIEHHLRVLAAHLELHLCEARGAVLRDALSGGDGAGKAHGVDFRRGGQRLADDGAAAHHQIEDSGGHTGAREDVGERPCAAGNQVRRLEDDAI